MPSQGNSRETLAKEKLMSLEQLLETDILANIKCVNCGSNDVVNILLVNGKFVCNKCGAHCDGCGTFSVTADLLPVEIYNRHNPSRTLYKYCSKCIVTCALCGKIIPQNQAHSASLSFRRGSTQKLCRPCIGKLHQCGCCGNYDYKHKVDHCKKCISTWCSDPACKDNMKRHRCTPCVDVYLSQHNFKPPTIFLPSYRHDELYMGVELEFIVNRSTHFECCDELTRLAKKLGDFFYLKRDGSLGDWGVELVTQPATLEYHTKTPAWRLILNAILKNGGTVNDSCGLHVHVSKNYLTAATDGSRYWECGRSQNEMDDTFKLNLWKLSIIFNKFWLDMFKASRRTVNSDWINRYCKKPPNVSPEAYYDLIHSYHEYGKYTAVNIVNNYTVEYRLWAATVKETEMLGTIELTAAITRFCKENSIMGIMSLKDVDRLYLHAVNKYGMKRLGAYLDNLKIKWRD